MTSSPCGTRRRPSIQHARVAALWLTLALCAGLLAQHATAEGASWEFEIKAGASIPSTLTLSNHCHEPHLFRVRSKHMPFFRLGQGQPITVPANASVEVPVTFDASGLAAKTFRRNIVIRCANCRREPGCRQDKETIAVVMTVVAPGPAGDGAEGDDDDGELPPELFRVPNWVTSQCPQGTRMVTRKVSIAGNTLAYSCCYRDATTVDYTCPQGGVAADLNDRACCRTSGDEATQSCWDCSQVACPSGSKLDGNACVRSGGCFYSPNNVHDLVPGTHIQQ